MRRAWTVFRVIYCLTIFTLIGRTYVIIPYSNKELRNYFDLVHDIIKDSCLEDQYYHPYFMTLHFGDTGEAGVIGLCHSKVNGFTLTFDESFWESLSDTGKKQLMLHEMVHCMFDQGHVANPDHFMAPTFVSIPEEILDSQIRNFLYLKCR